MFETDSHVEGCVDWSCQHHNHNHHIYHTNRSSKSTDHNDLRVLSIHLTQYDPLFMIQCMTRSSRSRSPILPWLRASGKAGHRWQSLRFVNLHQVLASPWPCTLPPAPPAHGLVDLDKWNFFHFEIQVSFTTTVSHSAHSLYSLFLYFIFAAKAWSLHWLLGCYCQGRNKLSSRAISGRHH